MDVDIDNPDAPGLKLGMGDDPEAEFSLSAFEALERDFQEVLATLAGDRSLDRFRAEYEKIHRALKRSHDHERKLIKKVKDLNNEIVNNASKVHTALKLSQDDQQTITTLRAEVEKAWKMVRSPRFEVLRCLHFLGWTRGHLTMTWVVLFSILRPFGLRAGARRSARCWPTKRSSTACRSGATTLWSELH